MLEMSRVKVHSKLTALSSKPTEAGKILSFTSQDYVMGVHSVHMVFYYRANPFQDGPMKFDLDNLRFRLSDLLCYYPKVTGRLDGNWELKCNDAGVRMLRASVGTTVDEWLTSADASDERDLTVWEDMSRDPTSWSPFRIQINDFEGGGLAIGLSFTHMLADLPAATLFFKSWADFHCTAQTLAPTPLFHLPPSFYTKRACPKTNTQKSTPNMIKMATATFRFPSSKMKQRLSELHVVNATPFDLLTALFWWRITYLKKSDQGRHNICICVDLRKYDKSIRRYFGNALYFSRLIGDDLENCKLEDVVRLVHDHMEGIDQTEDMLSNSLDCEPFNMYGRELTCIGLDLCPELMYGATFKKDDKPVHVSYHVDNVASEGLIMVMPSPEEGLGRTVTVTLLEEHITSLFQDKALLEMEPELLLSKKT